MQRKKFRTSKDQRQALTFLRKHLGEQGYLIFTVARHRRKHLLEFIALTKALPRQVVLVRPTPIGSIQVRPFCTAHLNPKTREAMQAARRVCNVPILAGLQIKPLTRGLRPEHWLTPDGRKELHLLIGVELYPKSA